MSMLTDEVVYLLVQEDWDYDDEEGGVQDTILACIVDLEAAEDAVAGLKTQVRTCVRGYPRFKLLSLPLIEGLEDIDL